MHEDWERARQEFHELVELADAASLRRRSNGTRWTNRQLLFHMLLGYLIIRALLRLVRIFGRLPDGASRAYAWILNAGTKPFDAINSCQFSGPRASTDQIVRRDGLPVASRTTRRHHD
ncbi:hypothetical protein ACWF0M_12495 [Kribbella sp. NPDC055110]